MQDPSLRLDALLADLDVPEDAIDVPRLAPTSPVARPRSRGSRAAKVRGRPSPNLHQTRFNPGFNPGINPGINAATGLPPGHLAPHVAPGSRQPLQARSSTLSSTAHHNNSANSTNGSNGHGHLNGHQHQQQPRRSTTAAQQAEQPQQSQRHQREVSGQGRDFRHDHDAASATAAGAGAGAGGSHAPRRPEGSDSDVSEESPELPEELINDTGDQLDVSSQSLDMALDMSVDLDR